MATESNRDACPECGAEVHAILTHGFGAGREGQPLPEATQQTTECPGCGAKLRRAVGDTWRVDETR